MQNINYNEIQNYCLYVEILMAEYKKETLELITNLEKMYKQNKHSKQIYKHSKNDNNKPNVHNLQT